MAVLKGRPVLYSTRFRLMGGEAEVKFVDRRGPEAARGIARRVEREALRVEAKFSRYKPGSVLSRINARAGVGPVEADEETCMLVKAALELSRATGGRFDPTVGALGRAWDFRKGLVPPEREIASLLALVDAGSVRVGPGKVHLLRSGMELDLGGVGKEYAADCASAVLQACGVASAIVNFAGDVRTLGRRGDGRPWCVGVRDPDYRERCLFTIRVRGAAGIATSGDYERCFERDGVRYHHLLDATTGLPSRGLRSATVVAPTAFMAGRLATGAFLLGPVEGLAFLERHPGVEGALAAADGSLVCTPGMTAIADLRGVRRGGG